MANSRDYYAAQVLRDGRVLAVGGERSSAGGNTNLAEIYDPVAGTWSAVTNAFSWVQGDVSSCMLPDGRVIYGSLSSQQTATYDPETLTWIQAGTAFGTKSATKQDSTSDEEGWVLLWDGSVLTVETNNVGQAERYVPVSDTWISAVSGTLPVTLVGTGAEIGPGTLLPDGRVFWAGASGHTAVYTAPVNATDAGTWTAGPDLEDSQGNLLTIQDGPSCLLPNGKVLLSAGPLTTVADSGGNFWSTPVQLVQYDPAANTASPLTDSPPALSGDTYNTRMLLVPSGEVLVSDTQTLSAYTPEGSPEDVWRPTILGLWDLGGGIFRLDGRQINGLSQACYYGDDVDCATNYPIVAMRSQADGVVRYCGTFGHSTMGTTPGTNIHSTRFTVPGGTPDGPATLQVIANGIASAPLPVTLPLAVPVPIPTSQGFAATRSGDWISTFWVGADASIWTVAFNGYHWTTPLQLAPANSAAPGALSSICRTPDHIDVFWIALDGSVRSAWWDLNANNAQWNGQFNIAPPNSAVPGAVAAISRAPNNVDVFWIAPDQSVQSNWWAGGVNNGDWNVPFEVAPANSALPGAISVASRIPSHLDVFWVTSGNAVMTGWWDAAANAGQWNSPFLISGNNAALPGAVAAVSRGTQNVDVFWIAPDQSVMTNWWWSGTNNAQWNTPFAIAPANSAAPTGISAAAKAVTHIDVFWLTPDQAVGSTFWDQNANSGNWNSPFRVSPPNSALTCISAVTRTPEQCDVFWVKPLQSLGSTWWNAFVNNGLWNPIFELAGSGAVQPQVSVLPPSSCNAGPAASRTPNQLDVFWAGLDGTVRTNWWNQFANNAAWNADFSVSAANCVQTRTPVVSTSRMYTQLDIFWAGPDGSVWSNWWNQFANGGNWNAQFQIASAGSVTASTPLAAVSRAAQNLDVFWTDPKGAIVTAWWQGFTNNAAWNPAFAIAPAGSAQANGAVTAVCHQPNHIDVFWITPDGSVVTVWWDAFVNGAQWNGHFAIAPASSGVAGAPLAAACRTANHVDVFWIRGDGAVMTVWWDAFSNGAQWNPAFAISSPGSAALGASIAAVARTPNHVDVFWIATDGSVMTNWWDAFASDAAWNTPFQIAPAGSARAGSWLGATTREPNHIDVFWVAPDGSVASSWWDGFINGAAWNAPFTLAAANSA